MFCSGSSHGGFCFRPGFFVLPFCVCVCPAVSARARALFFLPPTRAEAVFIEQLGFIPAAAFFDFVVLGGGGENRGERKGRLWCSLCRCPRIERK